ncbi:polysaccharide deacetylase family protein [Candidatus Roizmanbacteria bacterium]|nr:polysaccharide deacetylase family protein [Candidatus Roizmanbacteria bacterium]
MENNQYYDRSVFLPPIDITPPVSSTESQIKFKLPILMYHYVEAYGDPKDVVRRGLTVNPETFEQELKRLVEGGYTMYFAKDMNDMLSGETQPIAKGMVLTFDDGYEDFYTVVFPLLKKYHVKATVYVIYNYIDRKGFLTEREIQELINSGLVEIGCHTFDHAYLKNMQYEAARHQIIESKAKFEERFGIVVETFAYPFGAYDNNAVQLAKEAGYKLAVSVVPGAIHGADSRFYLTRIRPGIFNPADMIQVLEKYNK